MEVSEPTGLFDVSGTTQVAARLEFAESLLRMIPQQGTFNEFATALLDAFTKTMPCEAGSVIELDFRSQDLFFRAATGTNAEQLADVRIPLGKGIAGHVFETKEPYLLENADENQFLLKSIGKAVGFETRTMIAVPIVIRGKVYAVIELINKLGKKTFSPLDKNLARQLGELSACAVEVRLYLERARQTLQAQQQQQQAQQSSTRRVA